MRTLQRVYSQHSLYLHRSVQIVYGTNRNHGRRYTDARESYKLAACRVCLFDFLTSSSATRLYRGRAQRQSVWQFYVLPHMNMSQSCKTMTSVSASHIILTPTQPVGSGRSQRKSNPGPPNQESCALPTERPRSPSFKRI